MHHNPHSTIMKTERATYIMRPDPKVHFLYAVPEWVVAQATKGYTGVYSTEPMSEQEQKEYWRELGATKLKGPLEMATTNWMIEDVTRAFTHQLARYRLGTSMVQESQRFSEQVGELARITVPTKIAESAGDLEEYVDACESAMSTYFAMIKAGNVDIQDARAILPTGICTRLYLSVNMLSLAHIYEQRYCCQAQADEWFSVVKQFKDGLQENGFQHYAATLQAPWENPNCVSCGFGAKFDRPCQFADKFNQNLENLFWNSRTAQPILQED